MDFDVRVALGDMELSPEEVEALLAGQDGLLQFFTISYPFPTHFLPISYPPQTLETGSGGGIFWSFRSWRGICRRGVDWNPHGRICRGTLLKLFLLFRGYLYGHDRRYQRSEPDFFRYR